MGKRKYPKTNGYYVYSHSIDDVVYYGVSKQQPRYRWQKAQYKGTALEPYLNRWDDEKMVHTVIKDGLTKEQAYELEDWYIQNTPNCINKQRSGFIYVSGKQEYMKEYNKEHKEKIKQHKKKWYQEHKEEIKEYMKQYNKQYREEHKEKHKLYMREYRAKKRA